MNPDRSLFLSRQFLAGIPHLRHRQMDGKVTSLGNSPCLFLKKKARKTFGLPSFPLSRIYVNQSVSFTVL